MPRSEMREFLCQRRLMDRSVSRAMAKFNNVETMRKIMCTGQGELFSRVFQMPAIKK